MLIVPIADVWNDNYPLIKAEWLKDCIARKNPGDVALASYVSHPSHPSEFRPLCSGYFSFDS